LWGLKPVKRDDVQNILYLFHFSWLWYELRSVVVFFQISSTNRERASRLLSFTMMCVFIIIIIIITYPRYIFSLNTFRASKCILCNIFFRLPIHIYIYALSYSIGRKLSVYSCCIYCLVDFFCRYCEFLLFFEEIAKSITTFLKNKTLYNCLHYRLFITI